MIYIERDMFIAYMYILDHITCQNSLLYQNIVIVLDTYILSKVHIKIEDPVQNVLLNHIDF